MHLKSAQTRAGPKSGMGISNLDEKALTVTYTHNLDDQNKRGKYVNFKDSNRWASVHVTPLDPRQKLLF